MSDGGDLPTHRIVDNFLRREYGEVDSLGELLQADEPISDSHVDPEVDQQESRGDDESSVETTVVNPEQTAVVHPVPNTVKRQRKEKKRNTWGSREERMMRRNALRESASPTQALPLDIDEEASFVDWTTHTDNSYYYSFNEDSYIVLTDEIAPESFVEVGFKAVTVGVPRNFVEALKDPEWGEPARKEFHTITQATGAIIEVDQEIALRDIKNGADCLMMLAVYEEKVKEGMNVKMVRLVANGKTQKQVGETYAATPTRLEFLILLHTIAANGWDYFWIDEQRAFLTANRADNRPLYVRFRGDKKVYGVGKAVYGTKDASRDYRIKIDTLMIDKMKCMKLAMCSCIYIRRDNTNHVVLIYDHVDDFVFTGNSREYTLEVLSEFRTYVKTDDPVENASNVLGIEIERDKSRRIIMLRMQKKIDELVSKTRNLTGKPRRVPMPVAWYVVTDQDIDKLSTTKKRLLDKNEILQYLSIVGTLIWVQGVRNEIAFAVLYLSWNTKSPRQHHMDVAMYTVEYLNQTQDMPLVLGGDSAVMVHIYFDASHASGPRSRSITGILTKLNETAGAIYVKTSAQATQKLSSFESEVDGNTTAFKTANYVSNVLTELGISTSGRPRLFNDNEANINFVKGKSIVKGARHMELRMWYNRDEYNSGKFELNHMDGKQLPADMLTKPGNLQQHIKFTRSIQGLDLLPDDYFKMYALTATGHEDEENNH